MGFVDRATKLIRYGSWTAWPFQLVCRKKSMVKFLGESF
jgi:hypothetical protein